MVEWDYFLGVWTLFSLPLKKTETAFTSLHHHINAHIQIELSPVHFYIIKKNPYREKQRSKGASIFKFWDWRNLFAFLTSLTLIDEQTPWKRERGTEATEKQGHLIIMKARKKKGKKKRTRFDGPTHTNIHHTHIYTTYTSHDIHPQFHVPTHTPSLIWHSFHNQIEKSLLNTKWS